MPWNCPGPLLCHLAPQTEDQGLLVFDLPSWTHLILISLCYALGLCQSFKSCALLFHALPEPCPGPQCCLYNFLEGQPENSWPLGEEYCIPSNPSRYSGLHLPCFLQHVQQRHLSEPTGAGDRHTTPAGSPSVGGISSRATGLPGTMFAILGVSPAGRLGPNPCHPSPKVTNEPPNQISTPLLWNIWSIVSYQFVFKSLTNSYNQDPAPL